MKYTATYTMKHSGGGYMFVFVCAMCGFQYSTGWIAAESEPAARALAEKEARALFNGCHSCGRWVCDQHYNAQEMKCIKCAPY